MNNKPSKRQLSGNVVPAVRDYIDAAADEAMQPLVSDIRILHERINALADTMTRAIADMEAAKTSLEMKMQLMHKG